MKPQTNPADDSLISGMSPQNQTPQPQSANPLLGNQPVKTIEPMPEYPVVPPKTVASVPDLDTIQSQTLQTAPQNPSVTAADPNVQLPTNDTFLSVSPVESAPSNPAFVDPQQQITPIQPANQVAQPQNPPPTSQQYVPQPTSPFDSPPAPPQQVQPIQTPANFENTIVKEKVKKKPPVFLIILLLLVLIVLGAVGYLAYQNYILDTNSEKTAATQPALKTPTVTETDPYANYTLNKSNILPVEFMIPADWTIEETTDVELGNQKMIQANSPDFAYNEDLIASGYQFRVGPVSDLTKKYDTYDQFLAEENIDNSYTSRNINQIMWLIKGNEAKTLLENTPLIITLYSSGEQLASATEMFNKILNSFKITTLPVTQNPIPTSTPLE